MSDYIKIKPINFQKDFYFIGFEDKITAYVLNNEFVRMWNDPIVAPLFELIKNDSRAVFIFDSHADIEIAERFILEKQILISKDEVEDMASSMERSLNFAMQGRNVIMVSHNFVKEKCENDIGTLFAAISHELIHMAEYFALDGLDGSEYFYKFLKMPETAKFKEYVEKIFKIINENSQLFICVNPLEYLDEFEYLTYCVEAYITVKVKGCSSISEEIGGYLKEIVSIISKKQGWNYELDKRM